MTRDDEPVDERPAPAEPASILPGRTVASRMPHRVGAADWPELARLLRDAPVVHLAFVEAGQPRVMPIAASGDGESVLLHGSTGSRWLRLLATGIPVSLAVTALDGLVVARSAFESSMHYRSAVLFGHCAEVPEAEKAAALDLLTDALIPNRVAELRRPVRRELAATLVLRMMVAEFSLKVSNDWPDDADDDVNGPAWAGVLPARLAYQGALPAPDLKDGIEIPPSVRALLDTRRD